MLLVIFIILSHLLTKLEVLLGTHSRSWRIQAQSGPPPVGATTGPPPAGPATVLPPANPTDVPRPVGAATTQPPGGATVLPPPGPAMLPPAGPATTLRGPAIVPPPVRLTAATQQANTNQPVAGPSNLHQPATRRPAMPPPLPIHNRPHTNLQFHVETPEGMRQRLSRVTPSGPTRNMNKNKQRATTILFTPNRCSEQRRPELHSNSSSP